MPHLAASSLEGEEDEAEPAEELIVSNTKKQPSPAREKAVYLVLTAITTFHLGIFFFGRCCTAVDTAEWPRMPEEAVISTTAVALLPPLAVDFTRRESSPSPSRTRGGVHASKGTLSGPQSEYSE